MVKKLSSVFSEDLTCEVKHGIQFAIWNPDGDVTIAHVVSFLAGAIDHFIHERGRRGDRYAHLSPWTVFGKTIRGHIELLPPRSLPPQPWLEACEIAYMAALRVQQMVVALNDWRLGDAPRAGEFASELFKVLETPGGHLLALFILLKRQLAESLVTGDTLNKNLPKPIEQFGANVRLKTMRKKTGMTSIEAVREAAKNQ